PEPRRWHPPAQHRPALAVARFRRRLDHSWRRTSYSGLTAAAHAEGVVSEPETTGIEDEAEVAVPFEEIAGVTREPGQDLPSPMAELPAGAEFGSLVHEVLEYVDTTAAARSGDLSAELLARCREAGGVPGADPAQLAAALEPVLATPLGPLAGGLTLADIVPADRLAELEFELPLAGGDAATASGAPLDDLADLLRRHLPADDPFAGYADDLGEIGDAELRGYLTGSIDAVLRVRGDDGEPRYLVVDYKTNRLGSFEEPLTAWHYRPDAMAEAMRQAHYPLQLLLYSAALHRYLRWRQRGYDPARHLGGALYLFVRGMCGPHTPVADGTPYGVMAWRPPAGLVVDLSALLSGRRP